MSFQSLVEKTTPEQMLKEFPHDLEPLASRASSSSSKASSSLQDDDLFKGLDKEQIRLMEEACICCDYNDVPYAAGSKKTLHLMTSINKGLLHRAFSVFLFNSENKLLLQMRAPEKITFPNQWTNTCCSHPLAVTNEMGDNLSSAIMGGKNAAQRKLEHELGIPAADVPIDNFHFLTRIHYMAPSDGAWGEHEIDYIYIIRSDPHVNVNKNEIGDWKWVSADELKALFKEGKLDFTPWFKLICETYLFDWWKQIDALPQGDDKIARMF